MQRRGFPFLLHNLSSFNQGALVNLISNLPQAPPQSELSYICIPTYVAVSQTLSGYVSLALPQRSHCIMSSKFSSEVASSPMDNTPTFHGKRGR